MAIPLEDNFTDIIGKAQRGLQLSDESTGGESRRRARSVAAVERRPVRSRNSDKVAPCLAARRDRRSPISRKENGSLTKPRSKAWRSSHTPYHDIAVNSYLAWDPVGKEAVAFDTGADCDAHARANADRKVCRSSSSSSPTRIPITSPISSASPRETGAPVHLSELRKAPGAQPVPQGEICSVAGLTIESFSLPAIRRAG